MQLFLKRGLLFIAILVLYCSTNYALNLWFIGLNPPILKERNIVLGDSHVMVALDDTILPKTRNLAQTAEPYPATYFKLRELLKYNSIDTIYLGLGFHNISSFNDQKFIMQHWSNELFDRLHSITRVSDFKDMPFNKLNYVRSSIRNMMLWPNSHHTGYLGKFEKRKTKLDTVHFKPTEAISRHFYIDKKVTFVSISSIAYLDSIILLTTKNKIKLVAINTPIDRRYKKEIPKLFPTHLKRLQSNLTAQGVTVLDYSTQILPDSLFYDYDHLNTLGSAFLSAKIIKDIKNEN